MSKCMKDHCRSKSSVFYIASWSGFKSEPREFCSKHRPYMEYYWEVFLSKEERDLELLRRQL